MKLLAYLKSLLKTFQNKYLSDKNSQPSNTTESLTKDSKNNHTLNNINQKKFDEWVKSLDFEEKITNINECYETHEKESLQNEATQYDTNHPEFDRWMNLHNPKSKIKDSKNTPTLDDINQKKFDEWVKSLDFGEKISREHLTFDFKKGRINAFIQQQNIEYLTHFTRLENLENILKHGLLSREAIASHSIDSIFNDSLRLDNLQNSICTSISFPNYKMFYKLRLESPEAIWVILKLDPCILHELKAVFCHTNAASKAITSLPIHQLMTLDALKNMFSGNRANNIPSCFTTDPQAEVVFLETIPSKYIKEISFSNHSNHHLNNIKKRYTPQFNFTIDHSLFTPRSDYKHWSQSK
ncbi:DarT ssDNA thymidine ADP-ribosyltransferase family protein [Wohlfahrtiimonas chitiniclastica]|uniref:DarT ssDNA thymidine ADP-ribosyltransferase family protein n=1 Tax=Wohlfahrtiimonas chitiniclastica TaxID=400946 RepID=UPI0007B69919|nr:DarT ssDNA thymidine ADP-ribosyltransferase family protein [Wohlfahrtiimonas chitiniclastica]KZX37355.1 hypothetical protein A6V30_00235 [Wohlfahrtiimonas chitiniclastica]